MRSIAAAAGSNGRVDMFYLDPARGLHAINPDGVPELGGIFTSAPVAVSCLAREPLSITGAANAPPVRAREAEAVSPGRPATPAAPDHTPETPAAPAPAAAAGSTLSSVLSGPVLWLPEVQRVDIFGLGTDYAMYHKRLFGTYGSNTGGWESLGGIFISTPAAIAWDGGRVDVFGLGTDRAMYTKTNSGGSWTSSWERLGGTFASAGTVVSQTAGQLDLFAMGTDFTLRHSQLNGSTWSDWQNLGGNLASPPAAVSWGNNRVDVFAVWGDRTLRHTWWDGTLWNEWESLGGDYAEEPAVATWGPGRLDVFVLGNPHLAGEAPPDRKIYHHWFSDNAWSPPKALKGLNPNQAAYSSPTVVCTGPNQLKLFAPGPDPAVAPVDGFANMTIQSLSNRGPDWSDGDVGAPDGPIDWGTFLSGPLHLPNQGLVAVNDVKCIEKRSGPLESDTDYASASLAIGNWPTETAVQTIGDLSSNQESQTNLLSLGPVTMELAEMMSFNYIVINNGSGDATKVAAALGNAGATINTGSVSSISSQLGQGVEKIVSVVIDKGLSEIPVIGSLLGTIANWLASQVETILSANCDGIVAAELIVFPGVPSAGTQLSNVEMNHPGTNSNIGCGSNSNYDVWRTVLTGLTTTELNT